MSYRPSFRRLFSATAVLLSCLPTLTGCGSSGNTYTAPTALSKCAVGFDPPGTTLPATGGSGSLPVKTERECSWTAEPDVSWLSVTAGRSGQGSGTVEFAAAANGDPVARSGGIMLNGSRAQVTQAAAECRFTLGSSAASFSPEGGSGKVDVQASSALCTWSAASDSDWIALPSGGNGKGSAAVSFTVAPTTGPPRTGTLTIAGLRFSVTQSEGCTYTIAPSAYAAGAAGGSGVVTVTAAPGCPWTATSDVSWISIATTAGTGIGAVGFTVAPTTGPPRTGTLTIAGQPFTVTQSPGCSFEVSPLSHATDPGGGNRTVNVAAAAGCAWTATSNTPWITITGGATGNGAGTVTFAVAATTGPSRTGTISVAGQTVTVVQGQGCTYAAAPESQTIPSAGGNGTVAVTAGAGCAWTASSNAPWITIASGASGSGSGTVSFTAAPTTGPTRSGTITVAGQTVTVIQGQGCTFAVSPDTRSLPASGGDASVAVTAGAGCGWTAASNATWITILSGASGSGNGTVSFRAAATTGPSRSGTITVAGQTVTVQQGEGCTFAIAPETRSVSAAGADGTVAVTAASGCGWTARSNTSWITIAAGSSGSGNGSVSYHVASTTGAARSGSLTIAGRTFTINQGADCSIDVSPSSATEPASGGSREFEVRTAAGCNWTASSNASWLSITSGSSGEGNGKVRYTAAANSGPQRTGTITAGGEAFTVRQDAGCSFSISPGSQNAGSIGGNVSVNVTAGGGCAWTAESNAPWIGIASGNAGSGNGTVQLVIAANSGGDRTGTVTIAGQTFTVVQASGCSYSIAPGGQTVPAAGGSGAFSVNAAGGCAWTATANAPWIAVTSGGSGNGAGTVQFTAAANTGAGRSGTITAAGQTFTVTQDAGCSFVVAPETIAQPAAAGSQNVNVTTAAECSWSASSNAAWIAIPGAATRSGSSAVQLDIQANTGPARSGTAAIAGRTVTVNQDAGCSFIIAPGTQAFAVAGGSGTVAVTTSSSGCAWTAVSNAAWVTVTRGGGAGDGTVEFAVAANGTGAPRTGTITIAGQVFTIEQAGA